MPNIYEQLLKEFCDALISLQDKSQDRAFRGGIYCRACKMIHGRCPDAVYGLTVMAKRSGESKYLDAAKEVFCYGNNMLCTDGSLYNDAQAEWRYTTTFHAIAVLEALRAGEGLYDAETVTAFKERARGMAEWLYANLDENSPANINYAATNGLALALAGKAFGEEKYLRQAAHLVEYAMRHITQNGLLYGETKPHGRTSAKGCVAVDIGYNVEETVPALVKYAKEMQDERLADRLEEVVRAHLAFMLPDGGWDNSFGNRNNKWTYWGSRTSDGCAPMFLLLAERDPSFAEAALRNTQLLHRCTVDGFLYGGPDYHRHGEYPCTHHLFEHMNSIAYALEHTDEKYLAPARVPIPADGTDLFAFYPEIKTYKMAKGDWSATITDYDFDISFSGHATGGTLTALYHKKAGPIVMASVTDYVLVEPTNMQQALDRRSHRSLVPRFRAERNGKTYHSSYFTGAEVTGRGGTSHSVAANTGLATKEGERLEGASPHIVYTLSEKGMRIGIDGAAGTEFVLPLICGEPKTFAGTLQGGEEIFFLTGGFIAREFIILPDKNGRAEIEIAVSEC